MEDARGHELELELAVLGDYGVPRVVAALRADDHVRALGQVVDDLSFALVAPLAADQNDDHMDLFGPGLGAPRLQVVEPRVVAAEPELDRAGGAVAMLGDDHLGNPGLLV